MKNIILSSIKKVSLVVTMLLMHWMASAATYTWNGSTSTDWNLATNWSAGFPGLASLAGVDVLVIPDASTTPNDPSTGTAISSAFTNSLQSNISGRIVKDAVVFPAPLQPAMM